MCIIIVSKHGQIPNRHLAEGIWQNPDGWGFCYPHKGDVEIIKGMEIKDFWLAWKDRPKRIPVVVHFRIATHGQVAVENCHPFSLPDHGLAIAHNGIIADCADKRSGVSDTVAFCKNVLNPMPLGFQKFSGVRNLLERYIGVGNKVAIMDGNGKVNILNSYRGYWVKGNWYSNKSYLPMSQGTKLDFSGCTTQGSSKEYKLTKADEEDYSHIPILNYPNSLLANWEK